MSYKNEDTFITVVSVSSELKSHHNTPVKGPTKSEYVTVLTINNEDAKSITDTTEEITVYRLPGERLGFGLKFEGGTKAHECVKRLYIQSCAPDSPASRVQSSWGKLEEGDEVLEIDSVPIKNMTRIDCVRYLKESNMTIKLLVRHYFIPTSKQNYSVVINTEERKPPLVPPRKHHRKLKSSQNNDTNHDNIIPIFKHEALAPKSNRLQSPMSSFRKKYSPDLNRRLSDVNFGPPDADVYLDLISQESTQSLSESDDTGSSISTVLDRFASFPTTTTSSFAGSLPSTPTSIQKHLDLSYIINDFDDDDLFPVVVKSSKIEENNNIINNASDEIDKSAQESESFSYSEQIHSTSFIKEFIHNTECPKPPAVAPRSRDSKQIVNEVDNTLPRLVNFVPKKELDDKINILKRQFEQEVDRLDCDDGDFLNDEMMEYENLNRGMDMSNSKWIFSPPLSTIGEDDEDQKHYKPQSKLCLPFESILSREEANTSTGDSFTRNHQMDDDFSDDNSGHMDVPPSNFRQPPDGHESPDYVEKPTLRNYSEEKYKVEEKKYQGLGFDRYLSSSNCDLRPKSLCNDDENVYIPRSNLLYMQSQSLIDMSIYSKEKGSSQSKRLSKLKGLVIPEAPETNSFNQINIPEIKSINPLSVDIETNQKETSSVSEITTQAPSLSSIISQSWMTSTNVPKYSPAFKRKSLKVLATNLNKQTDLYSEESSYEDYVSSTQSRHSDELKSLESISSPTRSDFNFDYRTSKMMTIKDNKDHLDSDNDSAVSSSLSSLNSRASPPPSFPNNDKLNTTNNVNVIIKKATDHAGEIVGERRNSRIEITNKQTSDPVTLQIAEKNENIVLKNVHVPILVNEPVVLEFVKHRIQPSQIEISGNLDTKPVPSKRTFVPSNPPPLRPPTVPPPQPPAVPPPKLPTVLPPQPPIVKERKTITEKTESKTNYFTNNKNDVKYFEKKQTQASVQSLKANFERRESSESILPIKPKPAVTIRKKSDETVVLKEQKSVKKEMYDEPVSKVENRRSLLNSRTNKNIVKEQKRPTSIEVISDALPISHHVEYVTVELTVNPADVPLGINITGGSDQEDKNIMINRIRYGSIAYKDGRLKKGDKIICINGQSTNGMTNEDAKNLLTEKCTNFSIIIEESNDLLPFSPISRKSTSLLSLSSETKDLHVGADFENKKPTHSVSIIKDSAGLGFSIEGGKDSPKGDVPLVIKKIFAGGVADKCGELRVGDEIVAINGINLQNLSRIEAWSQMKKLPDGSIKIDIFR